MTDNQPANSGPSGIPDRIDTSVPHSARFWNYLLGGKDNYEPDRQVGDYIKEHMPGLVDVARTSRHFLARAIRYLVLEEGIRQFLDIGTGLPTADNTHEVAQRAAADSRIVYVDNDPLVLAHARALLTSTPEGVTAYIDADVRDPEGILTAAEKTLDLGKPVALVLMGIMGHIKDFDEAKSLIQRLLAPLAPGSFLVHYDGTNTTEQMVAAEEEYTASGAVPYYVRGPEQIEAAFEGLEVVAPGVVRLPEWRPEFDGFGGPAAVDAFGGVGRKPLA
ncbi:SAM-dependent methyltransferase [Streptomyces sp. NBC_01803]|uniref:SAM-dependent methyltransferase n=1 Tax=Streptomyces sp. NBC_01803 TaxID=2975946 RepID=UPI002DD8BD03|nr:SAM-dependent methyltransferase [Streptomyces sp. NBC_01803]WSA44600.1 SAM-dependent methyltransferase [Streptomyces sp. NBC_01803]